MASKPVLCIEHNARGRWLFCRDLEWCAAALILTPLFFLFSSNSSFGSLRLLVVILAIGGLLFLGHLGLCQGLFRAALPGIGHWAVLLLYLLITGRLLCLFQPVCEQGGSKSQSQGGWREAKQNEGINGQPRASKTTAKIDTQADAHRYTDTDECRRRCKAVLASFPHTPLMEADGGEG